jgi:hypothetical protein
MLTVEVVVPPGPSQRFLITGDSEAIYTSGSGIGKVSATLLIDGDFFEEPDEGSTATLAAPGAVVTLPLNYLWDFDPGTHTVGIITYPFNASQTITFGRQNLIITGLGPVPD